MTSNITPSANGAAVAIPVALDTGTPLTNSRHEKFSQLVAAGNSYATAYREAGYESTGHHASTANGYRLAANPLVQARISMLCRIAAASATFDVQARLSALFDIAEADPCEIARVVAAPCKHCWPDLVYAAAVERYMASVSGPSPLTCPDTDAPRPDCRKGPHERVELTPSEQWSGRARRLVKSVKQKVSGEIVVEMHDQLAASAQLASLAGWVVDRNLNLNANIPAGAALPAATPESVLAAFHSLRAIERRPSATVAEQLAPIVAEQPTATPITDAATEPRESRVIVAEYDD
jgi:hypothetical protein